MISGLTAACKGYEDDDQTWQQLVQNNPHNPTLGGKKKVGDCGVGQQLC
jgi:hypothetical protein